MRLGFIAVCALLGCGACDLSIDSSGGHVGIHWDAPAALDQVEVVGAATVEVHVDPWIGHATATAHGSGGTLAGLTLRSADGCLTLVGDTAPGVVVMIEIPSLAQASLVGSGRVDVFDADTDNLDLALTGAGVVTADGRVRRVRITASGSGTVDAAALRANTGLVDLRGDAVAITCVSGSLDASVAETSVLIRRCD